MTENALIISPAEGAPATSSQFGEAIPMPVNDAQVAEVIAAADFMSRADARNPETAQTANEIFALLGENHPFTTSVERGEGNFDPTGPVRGADGRFVPSPGKFVPHSAMHGERARRKEAESKLREAELKVAAAEEKLNVLSELVNAAQNGQHPQQQPQQRSTSDELIDAEVDVFAAVAQLQQQNSRLQAERNEQKFLAAAKDDMLQFSKQMPDFFDGVQHLVKARDKELEIMGIADPKQRVRQIAIEEKVLMQQAFAAGKSPSALLYELARQRGFTGGRQPQPRPTPAYDPKVVAQLEQTQRAQSLNTSLSGAGGTGGAGLTVQQIIDLPEDQFDALVTKMGGLQSPQLRRAFGG